MSRRAVDRLLTFEGRHRFLQSDILYLGFNRCYIPYTRLQPKNNSSGYTFGKRLKVFIDLLLDSSYRLIQLISRTGLLISFLGIAFAIYTAVQKLRNDVSIPGWTFLVVIILVNSGIILTTLGVIAEYQWRIYDQLRQKPLHIIKEYNQS